jgi:uncharacterized protein involved in exopolysaccharide biosynthesis
MSDAATDATAALEPWTVRGVWRDYWRVAVIGLLAAMIAFLGSFIVPATYGASTRILIRAKDTTVLNSNGTPLGQQPGVVDSQLSSVLSDTQSALVSNRAVAERVVDELKLDKMTDNSDGIVATARRAFADAYKRTRAIVTHGFYKEADKRTAKIDMVQGGLGAKQVEDGYAMDVAATWDDPKIAAAVANAAADALVEMGNERFEAEAEAYRQFLETQTGEAIDTERGARDALARFKAEHGIVTTPEQDAQFVLQSEEDVHGQVRQTEADLEAARGQVASLQSDLEQTNPQVTTNQEIETGRSRTTITDNNQNPAYTQLLSQVQSGQANVAALSARLGALRDALANATVDSTGMSEDGAELARLQLDVQVTSDTRVQLATELEGATVNAQRTSVEVTRIDKAVPPTYPIAPKRYLYLAVGLLMGALAGFVWSFLRVQRRLRREHDGEDDGAGDGKATDDVVEPPDPLIDVVEREPVEVGASPNGSRATNGEAPE